MTTGADLSGVDLKVQRAVDLYDECRVICDRFMDEHGTGVRGELEADGEEYTFRLPYAPPTPPSALALLVGDCVNNLRASLDHMVYALAGIATPNPPNTAFPMVKTPSADGQIPDRERKRIQHLSPDQQMRVDHCQPFRSEEPNPATSDGLINYWLGLLATLNNTDKHRILNLAITGSSFMVQPDQRFHTAGGLPNGGLTSGDVVGRYKWTGSQPPTDFERRVTFAWDLALNDHGGLVLEVLWQCAKSVTTTIDYVTGHPRNLKLPPFPSRRLV